MSGPSPEPQPVLTAAQRDALELLGQHDGEELDGWKRRTTAGPPPRLNMIAALSLVGKGLAVQRLPPHAHYMAYSHDAVYSLTDAGREELSRA